MMRPERNNPRNRHNVDGRHEQQRMVRDILDSSKVRLTPRSYRPQQQYSLGTFVR